MGWGLVGSGAVGSGEVGSGVTGFQVKSADTETTIALSFLAVMRLWVLTPSQTLVQTDPLARRVVVAAKERLSNPASVSAGTVRYSS